MKIITISDVHGRDLWKEQLQEEADMYIFLGDYFDSFDIDGLEQIRNFREIVSFYRENPEKVVLLSGNHDISYLDFHCACSGFQNKNAFAIRNLLEPLYKSGELKACKVIDNYIFVHAGISKTWTERYQIDLNNLETEVNELFLKNLDAFCFQDAPYIQKLSQARPDGYGDNVYQSPMWIRPYSLMLDKLDGYIQVVGHTQHVEHTLKDGIWFIDCQESISEPFTLEL